MEDKDLFDKFLTGMYHLVKPFVGTQQTKPLITPQDFIDSPDTIVLQENPKSQVLVTNENIDSLIVLKDGTKIEDPGTTLVEMDNLGIEVKGKTNVPKAKFNDARFGEAKFE